MSDQHNNEEQEPLRMTNNRTVYTETDHLREQTAPDADNTEEQADPLSQVEDILNAAETEAEPENEEASAVEDETETLREDLQRLQAEFVNYRRRVERDRDVAKDNATFAMLEALLPVIDDIDAAHDAGDLDGPFAAISRKLISTLESFGLVKHDAETLVGEPFDPVHHEAMLRQPSSEIAEEHIVQVFRNGYLYNERVLRAAQVMVSAGNE